jgi:hypothetical protein
MDYDEELEREMEEREIINEFKSQRFEQWYSDNFNRLSDEYLKENNDDFIGFCKDIFRQEL